MAAPFFILSGPAGARLCCQWTSGHIPAGPRRFEIITPDIADAMGTLFGLYDPARDLFRLLPAEQPSYPSSSGAAPVDLEWRGHHQDVPEIGYDWNWEPTNGQLILCSPLAA